MHKELIPCAKKAAGIAAGMVAVVMEDNENTAKYREKYKCITAIQPHTKWQNSYSALFNTKYKDSFLPYLVPNILSPASPRPGIM
jgi:hypothetical protein